MDSFFMGSAQFVCCKLCRAIVSEFNNGHSVNKIDKNIHDKLHISGSSFQVGNWTFQVEIAHFRYYFNCQFDIEL
jgi:hypothetical protein